MKGRDWNGFVFRWKSLHTFRRNAGAWWRRLSSSSPHPLPLPKPSVSRSYRRRKGYARRKSPPPQSKPSSPSSPDALLQSISAIIAPAGGKPPPPAVFPGRGSELKEHDFCREDARRIAAPASLFPVHRLEIKDDESEDVSPKVEQITAIVRSAGRETAAMEGRLASSGVEITAEIAEMVVKRCFKAGGAAMRFFSWARRQPGFRPTAAVYNAMLYIAGEARDFDLVDELLCRMGEDSCAADLKTWTILVQHFGRGRKIGRALWAFEQMKKTKKIGDGPDKVAYSAIIRALCEAGKAEMAVEFYREMAAGGMVAGRDLYRALMTALAASGDAETARSIREDMAKSSSEEAASSLMLKSLCVSGNLEEALAEIRKNKETNRGGALDPEKVEILVAGLAKAGRVSEAMELAGDSDNNSNLCGHIVSGYLRRRDLPAAMEFLRRMEERGCSPTVRTYTEAIQHLSRAGEHRRACELFDRMRAGGTKLDMVAVVAMATGHVQNGRVAEAWELFDGMKDMKGTKLTRKGFSVFVRELCKVSEPEAALRATAEMLHAGHVPGDDIIRLVADSLREKGQPEKASRIEKTLRQALSSSSSPTSSMAEAAYEICDRPPEPDLERNRRDHELKVKRQAEQVHNILASSCDWVSTEEELKKSDIPFSPELAERVLRRCRGHDGAALRFFSWVGRSAGFTHTARAYNLAMKIAGAGKDFAFMRHLHEEMRRTGCPRTADTWTIMIAQYGRAGLTEMALKKFTEMKADGFEPNGSTFKFLVAFLCGKKGRRLLDAQNMFDEMLAAGFSPDGELIAIFVSSFCENGKISEARSCVEALTKRGVLAPQLGFSILVKALSRAGRVQEALELVKEMGGGAAHGRKVDRFIYGSLVNGLLRTGREAAALTMIEEMKAAGFRVTAPVYTSLMAHFFREKRPESAAAVLQKMAEEGCALTAVTCSVLLGGYVGAGKVSAAWDLFRRMAAEGPPPNFQTYSSFMAALCRAGRSEEAAQLIDDMVAAGISPSAVNFRTVFFGLNREGKHDLAQALLRKKWALSRKRRFLL